MLKKLLAVGILTATVAFTGCETMPGASASIETANLVQLQNKTWVATHIGNTEIRLPAGEQNVPSLQFDSATQRVSGADGCNRLMGQYTAGSDTLAFAQMAETMMACGNNTNVSQQFKQALARVTNYQVYGKTLKLLDRNGNVLIQLSSSPKAQ